MKDEKETLRKTADSIHVMEKFDPAILADVTAPVVSLYIPVHHTEREERRDIWDRDMFKDLMKDAERTLAETYDKDAYKASSRRPTTCSSIRTCRFGCMPARVWASS